MERVTMSMTVIFLLIAEWHLKTIHTFIAVELLVDYQPNTFLSKKKKAASL